ncbi:MAG: 3-phosphoglycerate dehydrogenase, partial [Chlorobiales bacterium]|nr:3-phosphoglycerate dehydrogenase [Chlorobiales bacterium]
NIPNMVGQITSVLADSGINIVDMLNKSRGDIAYNLLDLGTEVGKDIADKMKKIEGVLAVRII